MVTLWLGNCECSLISMQHNKITVFLGLSQLARRVHLIVQGPHITP